MPSSSTTTVSKCTIYPNEKSTIKPLKLSVSDLPMISCQYIQKGVLLTAPPYSFEELILFLKNSLSATLSLFPALAGRLTTDSSGLVYINCNDAGVEFIHAKAKHLTIDAIYSPNLIDVHPSFKEFFAYNMMCSYLGHHNPLTAVQVTELADGVFIGCTINHGIVDGTSFWHFFNTFAAICKGEKKISNLPDFTRDTVLNSDAVLGVPPNVTAARKPLRERVFHFGREAIQRLKLRANGCSNYNGNGFADPSKVMGNQVYDSWKTVNGNITSVNGKHRKEEISSFQSLCAQLWRSVIRARKLDPSKTSTFRIAINCRHRLEPKMDAFYFGNAIQSIPTFASVDDIISRDLCWCANLIHQSVVAQDDATVRRGIEDWVKAPGWFPLANSDGASVTMGSSPRFPMYDNDFGWGRPLAVRSGKANKFDGKISAYPGREGNGSIDLEVVLAPETMAGLENDMEFMQYVTPAV